MMGRRLISRSVGRKLVVLFIAMTGFVLLYEVSMFDLGQTAPAARPVDPTLPAMGARVQFTATAYCKGTTTASGVGVRTGIVASDPDILPVGSVVNISTHNAKYNGVYTVMDTGPKVQGRSLDLYMWSCHEALAFGRRLVDISVLRLGWNPSASAPSFIERLFRKRESARIASQTQPPAQAPGGAHDNEAASSAAEGVDGVAPTAGTEPSAPAPSNAPNVTHAPAAPLAPVASISNAP